MSVDSSQESTSSIRPHGEWFVGDDRAETEPLLTEARETFERLEPKPWVERAARAAGVGYQTEAVT